MPPRYLWHVMRIVSRIQLRAHTLAVEFSQCCGGKGSCKKCSCVAVQNQLHVLFTVNWGAPCHAKRQLLAKQTHSMTMNPIPL